jgi:hypothetical protein
VQISAGSKKPLQCNVGVHKTKSSHKRAEILPSLAAAKPLWYIRRPMSQISRLSCSEFDM